MVVEKVGVDKVREKLAGLKRKNEVKVSTLEEIERRIDEQEKEDKEKRDKKNKRFKAE